MMHMPKSLELIYFIRVSIHVIELMSKDKTFDLIRYRVDLTRHFSATIISFITLLLEVGAITINARWNI